MFTPVQLTSLPFLAFTFAATTALTIIILIFLYKRFKNRAILQINHETRQTLELEYQKKLRIELLRKHNEQNQFTKEEHHTGSKKHDHVTVLFADIQGFTKIVEQLRPETLVDELDKFFLQFDEVAFKYHIEKIKTIGDAYMCAGGIPDKVRSNPIEVILVALEMQNFMKSAIHPSTMNGVSGVWELRIGIHTGSVISGKVGRTKNTFDIWGDTVNIASRMESSGIPGEINITGVTYQYVKDFFECQYRGKMPIKYKGETDMYFVKRLKQEYSADENGVLPNEACLIKLQHIRFSDLEDEFLSRLNIELPNSLYFHNVDHTINAIAQVEIIGRGEGIDEKDLLLLKSAALFHDAGYLHQYHNPKEYSLLIATEYLKKHHFADEQIHAISDLINSTRPGNTPTNKLEEIMTDANMHHLGRPDFYHQSEKLLKEMLANGIAISPAEWIQNQTRLIESHHFFTNTARKLRQVNKQHQLEKLKAIKF
ncbi:MAG: guanylate cyclase [Marinilabiliaceae bacterium]|nr:guanylate cyclase [Marinilabiliaceae bacterium]